MAHSDAGDKLSQRKPEKVQVGGESAPVLRIQMKMLSPFRVSAPPFAGTNVTVQPMGRGGWGRKWLLPPQKKSFIAPHQHHSQVW